jgi:hypothetical protein
MIYEFRTYTCMPGRLADVLKRSEIQTKGMYKRLGLRPVGSWTTYVGESNQEVIFVFAWESLEEKERIWAQLLSDPEWAELRTETEKDGPLVANIKSSFQLPTKFSPLQ